MSNVWSELKKQNKKDKGDNIWANLGREEEFAPDPVAYVPIVVDNQLPHGTVSFDIETGSVDFMFSTGPEFLRLSGYSIDDSEVYVTVNHGPMTNIIQGMKGWIVGHNIMNFDLILLAKHFNLDLLKLAMQERVRDTKIISFLADPPYSRTKEGEIERIYSLENQGTKYLGEGKMKDVTTGKSVLKRLAAEFGGFDKIPVDHPEYIEYLIKDVEVTRDLVKVLPVNDYTIREHKVAAVAATISIQGFRVDVPLLEERIRLGEEKRDSILTSLQGYGLPSPESSKAPHRTNAGKAAIELAFSDLGVTLPRTDKGNTMMGKEVMEEIYESNHEHNPEAAELAGAVMSLNGIRTIYGNIYDNLVGDRVHPSINLRQSSGRWSIQKPGLTVLGKRGGKVIERAVFLPDNEDEVLISVDLSQVDARAVAALSQDTEYLKLFEDGRDLHAEMAERLFGTRDKRELAKPAAHGINYGMRAKKLSWSIGIDMWEAEDVVANFERSFPKLTRWQYEVRERGEVTGILYNGFGRMMRIESERAFTQSPALMGQSTARDILMEGILNLWKADESLIKRIRAVVHDELVLSVPKKDAVEIGKIVVDSLTFPWCPVGGTYEVMIEAGINKGVGKHGIDWSDTYCKGCEVCESD